MAIFDYSSNQARNALNALRIMGLYEFRELEPEEQAKLLIQVETWALILRAEMHNLECLRSVLAEQANRELMEAA